MQSKQILDTARESSRQMLKRVKSEITKLSKFVPISVQSALAVSSVSRHTSLALKEVSSLAIVESANIAQQQQQKVLTKLLQGSARILTADSLPTANKIVDSWILIAKAHRDGLMATTTALETSLESSLQTTAEVAKTQADTLVHE